MHGHEHKPVGGNGAWAVASPHRPPDAARVLPPLCVALITLATFLPALRCGFVNWDDDRNIVENVGYRGFYADHLNWMFTTYHGGHYQPLTWLSFALDHAVWGLNPIGYHLSNVLGHVLAAVLCYFLAIRLLALARPHELRESEATDDLIVRRWSAAFAALVFALHPLRVESVVWVTERRDVLSGVFFFACLLAYMRATAGAGRAGRWHLLAWVCLLLSLAAKAVAITLPVVMLVLDVYPLRRLSAPRVSWWRLIGEKLPYAALSLAAGVLAVLAQQSAGAWRSFALFGPFERVITACYSILFYLWKWVAPHNLTPLYPLPSGAELVGMPYMLAVPMVVALLITIVALNRRLPALAPAFLVYLVLLSPMSGLAQSGKHLVADRYSYLALLPLAMLAGGGMLGILRVPRASGARRRHVAAGVGVLLLGGLALLSVQQTAVWLDSESLWRHALRVHPRSGVAAVNLANVVAVKDAPAALGLFRTAIASDPADAKAHNGLGRMLIELNQPHEALAAFQTAVELAPGESGYRANLGYTLAGFGRLDEAASQYREAVALNPYNASAAHMHGTLLRELGRYADARAAFEAGLQAVPGDRTLMGDLAWLLATCPDDAVRDGARAVQLGLALAERTGYADAHVLDTLAAAYAEAGQYAQALATIDAALRIAREQRDQELLAALVARRARYAAGEGYREP